VSNQSTKLTQDDYGFFLMLLGGLVVVSAQLVKFFDTIPGNKLWDGTFVTGAIFAVGLAGVLICVANYFQIHSDMQDVNDRDGFR